MEFLKRTWATIDLRALQQNFRAIRQLLSPDCRMIPVIKADAYGHGSERCALALVDAGAEMMAVSNFEEALKLRDAGVELPILILGYTPPELAKELAAAHIVQTLLDEEYARRLSVAASAADVTVDAHIKLDTGMSRLGFWFQDAERDVDTVDAIERTCRLPHLAIDGIFTHFTSADEADGGALTDRQFADFQTAIARLEARGIHFHMRHCCNSAATLGCPEKHLDAVRPGLILYGLYPDAFLKDAVALRPVMQMKSVISMLKTVPAGAEISYGRTYRADREMRVATVPIGYADGYPRAAGNRGYMLVAGKKAPVIGRVCMDQCMLDVTDIPDVYEGMTVTVFGEDGGATLAVEEVAAWQNTISYEIVCLVSKRVPRVYEA